jgi:hypothetical protein
MVAANNISLQVAWCTLARRFEGDTLMRLRNSLLLSASLLVAASPAMATTYHHHHHYHHYHSRNYNTAHGHVTNGQYHPNGIGPGKGAAIGAGGGAVIGALAGGGKGALIGGAIGAGGGAIAGKANQNHEKSRCYNGGRC